MEEFSDDVTLLRELYTKILVRSILLHLKGLDPPSRFKFVWEIAGIEFTLKIENV